MIKINQMKLDGESAVRGAWMSTGIRDDSDGTELRFRISRWNQSDFSRFVAEHQDKDWTSAEMGLAYVGARLIKEVEGLCDDEGEPITWTPEFGLTFFHSVQMVDRFDGDEEPETFRPLEYVADACLSFARSEDNYIRALSGNS